MTLTTHLLCIIYVANNSKLNTLLLSVIPESGKKNICMQYWGSKTGFELKKEGPKSSDLQRGGQKSLNTKNIRLEKEEVRKYLTTWEGGGVVKTVFMPREKKTTPTPTTTLFSRLTCASLRGWMTTSYYY